MAGMDEYAFALRFRGIIRRIVLQELERERPRPRYGVVSSIDRVAKKCYVLFPGDEIAVPVLMGTIQPDRAGRKVRVVGVTGDRYIEDVLGEGEVAFIAGTNIP